MDRTQEIVDKIVSRKEAFSRIAPVVQAVIGVFLLWFGWQIGKTPIHLLENGLRTEGLVVEYTYTRSHNRVAYYPIVEFTMNGHLYSFRNWMGSNSERFLHSQVPVLYDANDPHLAMIDRPLLNWIPWAPILLLGTFLVFVALKAGLKSIFS